MTDEEITQVKTFLASQYEELYNRCSLEKRVQILSIIIEIKLGSHDIIVQNSKNSLYLDVKHFVSAYLRNKRNKDFGYEDYNKNLLINLILSSSLSLEKQYRLLAYLKYILETLSYEFKYNV